MAATLGRKGIRPAHYHVCDHGLLIMASETGLLPVDPERIVEKGRLGPGQMLAVDTRAGRLLHNDEIKREFARRRPYGEWLQQNLVRSHLLRLSENGYHREEAPPDLVRRQKAFG